MDAKQMRDGLQRIRVELERMTRTLDEEIVFADEKVRQDAERQRIFQEVQAEQTAQRPVVVDAPIEEVSTLGAAQPTKRSTASVGKRNDDK